MRCWVFSQALASSMQPWWCCQLPFLQECLSSWHFVVWHHPQFLYCRRGCSARVAIFFVGGTPPVYTAQHVTIVIYYYVICTSVLFSGHHSELQLWLLPCLQLQNLLQWLFDNWSIYKRPHIDCVPHGGCQKSFQLSTEIFWGEKNSITDIRELPGHCTIFTWSSSLSSIFSELFILSSYVLIR